jgi:hypothetical protein
MVKAHVCSWHNADMPPPFLSRAGPPRKVIRQHIDRDRGQAHHDPDPEHRGMMDPSPVASGVLRLHSAHLVSTYQPITGSNRWQHRESLPCPPQL